MIKIGIEHEFVFKDRNDTYLDFENSTYSLFQKIVDAFPYIKNDDLLLECKSLEKFPKRCYVEGFERYDREGNLLQTLPSGLEIRTLPHSSIDAVIKDFTWSYRKMKFIAKSYGLSPLLTSTHPYKNTVQLKEPMNSKESTLRSEDELALALNSMLIHGLQVNISIPGLSEAELMDRVHKINYYLAYLIPFGFSSPFHNGKCFSGLSYRAYFHAKTRSFTNIRKRKGVSVIEFGGFDACGDEKLLKAQLLLFKGLLLDKTLMQRSEKQNSKEIQHSALKGLEDPRIKEGAVTVLNAVKEVLPKETAALEYLKSMLHSNDSYALKIKKQYEKTGGIVESLSDLYSY